MHTIWNAAETVLETVASTAAETNGTTQNTTPLTGMGDMLTMFLVLMLFGSGIYALYTYFRLHRTCMLFPNKFLYPGGCTADTCVDVDGFIDFIEPRLLLLGVVMILLGGAYVVYAMALKLSSIWVDITTVIVPVGVFIWYMLVQRKAAREFW